MSAQYSIEDDLEYIYSWLRIYISPNYDNLQSWFNELKQLFNNNRISGFNIKKYITMYQQQFRDDTFPLHKLASALMIFCDDNGFLTDACISRMEELLMNVRYMDQLENLPNLNSYPMEYSGIINSHNLNERFSNIQKSFLLDQLEGLNVSDTYNHDSEWNRYDVDNMIVYMDGTNFSRVPPINGIKRSIQLNDNGSLTQTYDGNNYITYTGPNYTSDNERLRKEIITAISNTQSIDSEDIKNRMDNLVSQDIEHVPLSQQSVQWPDIPSFSPTPNNGFESKHNPRTILSSFLNEDDNTLLRLSSAKRTPPKTRRKKRNTMSRKSSSKARSQKSQSKARSQKSQSKARSQKSQSKARLHKSLSKVGSSRYSKNNFPSYKDIPSPQPEPDIPSPGKGKTTKYAPYDPEKVNSNWKTFRK
jgi:hypothetical protein